MPGEMFTLAMEAQRERGMGVVGSTSNILSFITDKVSVRSRFHYCLSTRCLHLILKAAVRPANCV